MRSGKAWLNEEIHSEFPVYCQCGALARPGVLWFGESYNPKIVNAAVAALEQAGPCLDHWYFWDGLDCLGTLTACFAGFFSRI